MSKLAELGNRSSNSNPPEPLLETDHRAVFTATGLGLWLKGFHQEVLEQEVAVIRLCYLICVSRPKRDDSGLMLLGLLTFCITRAQNSRVFGIAKKVLKRTRALTYHNIKAFYLGPCDNEAEIRRGEILKRKSRSRSICMNL